MCLMCCGFFSFNDLQHTLYSNDWEMCPSFFLFSHVFFSILGTYLSTKSCLTVLTSSFWQLSVRDITSWIYVDISRNTHESQNLLQNVTKRIFQFRIKLRCDNWKSVSCNIIGNVWTCISQNNVDNYLEQILNITWNSSFIINYKFYFLMLATKKMPTYELPI